MGRVFSFVAAVLLLGCASGAKRLAEGDAGRSRSLSPSARRLVDTSDDYESPPSPPDLSDESPPSPPDQGDQDSDQGDNDQGDSDGDNGGADDDGDGDDDDDLDEQDKVVVELDVAIKHLDDSPLFKISQKQVDAALDDDDSSTDSPDDTTDSPDSPDSPDDGDDGDGSNDDDDERRDGAEALREFVIVAKHYRDVAEAPARMLSIVVPKGGCRNCVGGWTLFVTAKDTKRILPPAEANALLRRGGRPARGRELHAVRAVRAEEKKARMTSIAGLAVGVGGVAFIAYFLWTVLGGQEERVGRARLP
mmetsp:Transcript_46252/g.150389  ORF Transcript_46252/g.150389 Transcript_46252/m.150389 type:complete len:306 (-) Transcript_46252:292-1209(-)